MIYFFWLGMDGEKQDRARLEDWIHKVRTAQYPRLDSIKPHTFPCPGLQIINGSLA